MIPKNWKRRRSARKPLAKSGSQAQSGMVAGLIPNVVRALFSMCSLIWDIVDVQQNFVIVAIH